MSGEVIGLVLFKIQRLEEKIYTSNVVVLSGVTAFNKSKISFHVFSLSSHSMLLIQRVTTRGGRLRTLL
jgi:hypothetical protein